MKLSCENVVFPDRRSKRFAVVCAGRNYGGIRWLWKKAVDEINVASIFHTLKQWAFRLHDLELIPSDLRNLQSIAVRKSHHAAVKNSEAGGAAVKFFALVKKRLVADAYSKKGPPRFDELATRLQQSLL